MSACARKNPSIKVPSRVGQKSTHLEGGSQVFRDAQLSLGMLVGSERVSAERKQRASKQREMVQ
eukprot:3371677-Amphidinium_carterae.1